MLDHDISTAEALARLSVNDNDPSGFNRRQFLKMVGWGVGGGAVLGSLGAAVLPELLPSQLREAWATSPIGPNDGVLVLVGMYGGNDGLNTVIPYGNGLYYDYRANIAIPQAQVLPIDANIGLHPNLAYIKSLYDQNMVAIVQGVGYPNPDLSHFNSMATWMYGRSDTAVPTSGWVGRWLDGLAGGDDLFKIATVGSSLPLHMIGVNRRGTTIPEWGIDFGGGTSDNDLRMYNAVRAYAGAPAGRGPWHDMIAQTERSQIDVAQTVAPVFVDALPSGQLLKKMTVAARLINADLGLRVIDASYDNFDTHSDEPTAHGDRMAEFDAAIQAFYATLDPRFQGRVTVMTFSEFGRTPWSNDSMGTDHGTANNHFVIGPSVRGGLYGQQPSLTGLARWDRMDFNVDFRSLYTSVLDGWLGGGASTVLNGTYTNLNLFNPPGSVTGGIAGVPPPAVSVPTEFVGVVPFRLMDSREGVGGPKAPFGQGMTRAVKVTGLGGVPTVGVTAAVLNVTAVGGSAPSFVTVWPAGITRPNTSSLNTRGGDVVPNLVITMLNGAGQANLYNNSGSGHCVVDVVGYFRSDPASRFTSLTPTRILDTRGGLGAPQAPVDAGMSIDLQVASAGGVVSDADSVVMNVTVTEPTTAGFITVWPTGSAMPTASNLNFVAGQTVPNLVISKLGTNGQVSLFNSSGSTQLIADVLGYFRAGSGARLTSMTPVRLLDTRSDGGVSRPVAQTPLVLPVAGHNGVPASGVVAVVLNVTATEPTVGGFVTVFPSGEAIPVASNLNTVAGQTRANLVIAKLGADGAVAMYNSAGTVQLVADVVGYFTA
jgi:uncharacterized protein (DUF1501 family)